MSLKALHIVFIALSVLTAFFFGAWLFLVDDAGGTILRTVFGTVSFLVGIGLFWYGRYFVHKFKNFSYY